MTKSSLCAHSLLTLFVLGGESLFAQTNQSSFSGSFETNSIYYVKDSKTGATRPKDNYGSNNYLKLDYRYGKFSAGLQAEYYPQVLQGYEEALHGFGIPEKYIAWTDKNFSVTLGDFYEQFGSGLILRAWEDRALGLNNSIGGGRVTFNLKDLLFAKVIYGFPRNYLSEKNRIFDDYTDTQVMGGDLSFSLLRALFPSSSHTLLLEGSVVNRYEKSIPEAFRYESIGLHLDRNNLSYSGRLAYEYNGITLKGEYVGKEKDLFLSPKTGEYELRAGNAQLFEAAYVGNGLSATALFRRLDNMQDQIYRTEGTVRAANTLNYLPGLCQQHAYMLAVLNPYTPFINGEIGGQLDVFYNFKKGTWIGGKTGLKVHGNVSLYYSLDKAIKRDETTFNYRDVTFDIEKKWNRNLKSVLFASIQEYTADHGTGESALTVAQNVFVADLLYKFNSRYSLRGELQYLYSEEGTKDWMAGLLEFGIAPKWSLYVSDMYNHGDTKTHYYSGGASFTYSMLRVALSYGRNRAGYICSGGVCRYQPAYTGANLGLTVVF